MLLMTSNAMDPSVPVSLRHVHVNVAELRSPLCHLGTPQSSFDDPPHPTRIAKPRFFEAFNIPLYTT